MTRRPFETTARSARRTVAVAALAAMAGSALVACAGNDTGTADVLAASSFTDVAEPLEALLEGELDVDIRFSFGSSGSFLEQIDQGAPASVVVTADTATMERIEDAGLVEPGIAITRNELVIVTADTATGRTIGSLADLADLADGGALVICTASAPCGAATDELAAAAGVELSPVSREPNVRATLTKVLLGEADAAIVYRTDAVAHPELRTVEVGVANVSVIGRAAAVIRDDDDGDEGELGRAIVDLLAGERAAALFAEAGFAAP